MIFSIKKSWAAIGLVNLVLLCINVSGYSQCDYSAPASFTLTHTAYTAGASVAYYLVGSDGKIKYTSSSTSFTNVASGAYKAYAYVGAAGVPAPGNAAVGALWSTVSQNCMIAKSATINVCDNCSGLLTWGAVNSGSNPLLVNTYALVNNVTGLIVATNNSAPSFAAPFNGDLHQLWAFNYSGTPNGITVGSPVSAVLGGNTCLSQTSGPLFRACYDFSNIKINGAGTNWPDAYATVTSRGHTVWLGANTDNPTIEYVGYNGGTDLNTSGLTLTEPGEPQAGNGSSANPFILNVSFPTDYFEFNLTVNGANANGSSNVYWAIWFDANNNGSFADADDLFASGTTAHGSPVTVTSGFILQNGGTNSGAAEGKIRAVATAIPTTFTKSNTSAAAKLINGEVEDYYVSYLSILPVSLLSFEAVKQSNKAVIFWKTASEQNTGSFVIERSANGQTGWQSIGTVSATGNSNTVQSYSHTDNSPLGGINYYRLRIMDKDGSHSYSDIKQLSFDAGLAIKLSPNPANGFVTVTGLAAKSQIGVYDGQGKLLQRLVAGSSLQRISLAGYAAGTYLIRVTENDKLVYVGKVIKQ
jgi:hypothetical protein